MCPVWLSSSRPVLELKDKNILLHFSNGNLVVAAINPHQQATTSACGKSAMLEQPVGFSSD